MKKYINTYQEHADRLYNLYSCFEKFSKYKCSRKRKSLLRKMFRYWYKCPDYNGVYNEDYWTWYCEVTKNTTFRELFIYNINGISNKNVVILLQELDNRCIKYDNL